MADTVKIQVITSETVLGNDFVDAIYYSSMAAYDAAKADGSHEAQKATRVSNYTNAVQNPPAPKVYTKAELQAQKAEYVAQTDAQIAFYDAEIAKK